MTDNARYTAALERYFVEPEAITDADLSVLAGVDDALAEKAATRRSDALRLSAEHRHRVAIGLPNLKTDRAEHFAELVTSTIIAQLARPRQRIKALEAQNVAWEQRYNALESRVLELEAQAAARTVTHVER
jgi:hypothetical protein